MKRLHIHISAADLEATKRYYSALFGQAPTVDEPDYMKWMLDEPRIKPCRQPTRWRDSRRRPSWYPS